MKHINQKVKKEKFILSVLKKMNKLFVKSHHRLFIISYKNKEQKNCLIIKFRQTAHKLWETSPDKWEISPIYGTYILFR